jgi:hypothetical protein
MISCDLGRADTIKPSILDCLASATQAMAGCVEFSCASYDKLYDEQFEKKDSRDRGHFSRFGVSDLWMIRSGFDVSDL